MPPSADPWSGSTPLSQAPSLTPSPSLSTSAAPPKDVCCPASASHLFLGSHASYDSGPVVPAASSGVNSRPLMTTGHVSVGMVRERFGARFRSRQSVCVASAAAGNAATTRKLQTSPSPATGLKVTMRPLSRLGWLMAGAMAVSVATNIGGFVEEAAGSFVIIPVALLESPYLSANRLSEIGLAVGVPRSAAIKALSSTGRRTSSVTASLLVAVRLARETVRARVAMVSIAMPITIKSVSMRSTSSSSMPRRGTRFVAMTGMEKSPKN